MYVCGFIAIPFIYLFLFLLMLQQFPVSTLSTYSLASFGFKINSSNVESLPGYPYVVFADYYSYVETNCSICQNRFDNIGGLAVFGCTQTLYVSDMSHQNYKCEYDGSHCKTFLYNNIFDMEVWCNAFSNTINGGIAVNPSTGELAITDRDSNSIYSYDQEEIIGCLATDNSAAYRPIAVAFNSINSSWFIITEESYIYECSTATFNDCWIANDSYGKTSNIRPYLAIAADSKGYVFGFDYNAQAVFRCGTSLDTTCVHWVSNILVSGSELCYDPSSGIAIANDHLYLYDCSGRVIKCSVTAMNNCRLYIDYFAPFGWQGYVLYGIYYTPALAIDRTNGIMFLSVQGTSIFAYFDKALVEKNSCNTYFRQSKSRPKPLLSTANKFSCFSGEENVQLIDSTQKRLQDIVVGDVILTADKEFRFSYSRVIALPHKRNQKLAEFLHITADSGESLRITSDHILFYGSCDDKLALKQASEIVVGNCIQTVSGRSIVSDVRIGLGRGLYSVVTKNEFVVVNGIIASPFAASHGFGHLLYVGYRVAWEIFPVHLMTAVSQFFNSALSYTGEVLPTVAENMFFS